MWFSSNLNSQGREVLLLLLLFFFFPLGLGWIVILLKFKGEECNYLPFFFFLGTIEY